MPNVYPTEVIITEKSLAKVTRLFRVAYRDIAKEINSATDFGVANRKAILAQIFEILKELEGKSDEMLAEELPVYYKEGADTIVAQLRNTGAPLKVSTGFNRVHKEAIASLVDESSRAIAESIAGVGRSATRLLGRAVREQITQKIATGQVSGAALRTVRQQIKGLLQEEGLSALIDKGGKKWELDRYAEMVFRTKAVEGHNRGLINRLVENGYELVQVSNHRSRHRACAVWEGKILSTTGETKGYATVAEAESTGLFHPNCRHALNALVPSLAKKTKAYNPNTKTLGPAGASVPAKNV